jgi:lysophospholipid acyltransferase (LPLAT)-like uncharacterized protein
MDEDLFWQHYENWRLYGANKRLAFTLKQRAFLMLASMGYRAYERIVADTLTWEIDDPHNVLADLRSARANYIFAIWHNRLLGAVSYFERFHTRVQYGMRMAALVSESFDGELIARSIRDCNGENVRGSSSHNAVSGLKHAVDELGRGLNLCVTGDGPKGPRYEFKPGAIMAAKLSGKPIVPVIWSCSRTLQMRKSWDQFMVPLRHARMTLHLGEPTYVAKDASTRDVALARRLLETKLGSITQRADLQTRIVMQFPAPRENERAKLRKLQTVAQDKRM